MKNDGGIDEVSLEGNDFLKEIFYTEISSLFDPEARFNPEHKRNVRMISNALQKPLGRIHRLSKPILRNSFLYGCQVFARNEPIEHLIVGFGRRRGGGTDIYSILHITGNTTSVPVPLALIQLIQGHAIRDSRHETILFHNHPANWLNAILPFLPAASPADRRLVIKQKYFEPFFLLKNIFGHGTMRFYVGEQGRVKEIRLPYLKDVLDVIAVFQKRGKP